MPYKRNTPRVCETCGASFFSRLDIVKRGGGRYCKPRCRPDSGPKANPLPAEIMGDGTARIPLMGKTGEVRAYAIIDAADAAFVSQWRWSLMRTYACRTVRVNGRAMSIRLHRELLGLKHGDTREGDHINHQTLDNRRSNLRILPHLGNLQNRIARRSSRSQHRGVSWSTAEQKWKATVRVDGLNVHLGYFTSEHDAGAIAKYVRLDTMPYATD